jgi:hypothetical protein
MGRSKPFKLATRTFEKQSDAWGFFKELLSRYRPGDRVSGEDALLDVLSYQSRCRAYGRCAGGRSIFRGAIKQNFLVQWTMQI